MAKTREVHRNQTRKKYIRGDLQHMGWATYIASCICFLHHLNFLHAYLASAKWTPLTLRIFFATKHY